MQCHLTNTMLLLGVMTNVLFGVWGFVPICRQRLHWVGFWWIKFLWNHHSLSESFVQCHWHKSLDHLQLSWGENISSHCPCCLWSTTLAIGTSLGSQDRKALIYNSDRKENLWQIPKHYWTNNEVSTATWKHSCQSARWEEEDCLRTNE